MKKLVVYGLLSIFGGYLCAADEGVNNQERVAVLIGNLSEEDYQAAIDGLVVLSEDGADSTEIVDHLETFIVDMNSEKAYEALSYGLTAIARIGKHNHLAITLRCIDILFTFVHEDCESNLFGDAIDAIADLAKGVGFTEHLQDYIDEGVEDSEYDEDESEYDEDEDASGEDEDEFREDGGIPVLPFREYYDGYRERLCGHILASSLRMNWIRISVLAARAPAGAPLHRKAQKK